MIWQAPVSASRIATNKIPNHICISIFVIVENYDQIQLMRLYVTLVAEILENLLSQRLQSYGCRVFFKTLATTSAFDGSETYKLQDYTQHSTNGAVQGRNLRSFYYL
jgi:hypothetical protein